MKTEWKANATDPDDLTGVGTFIFDTGNRHIPFRTFADFHALVTLLDRELHNAAYTARKHLKDQIASIAI